MENSLEYLDKCNLKDMIQFRSETMEMDNDRHILRNKTRVRHLYYIAYKFMGYSAKRIAKDFGVKHSTVRSSIFIIDSVEIDKCDDVAREISSWKKKQLIRD